MNPRTCHHQTTGIITLSFCALLCGCIGATRLPTRAIAPGGEKIEQKELDLRFLQVGSTQREEVAHQLAAVDTAYSNPRLFWARWVESRWGYWWVVGWPCNNCMAGDAHRKWHMQNLLISFDENGTVATKESLGDDLIWPALHSRLLAIHSTAVDLSQPVRISLANSDPIAISLKKDRMEFERAPGSGKETVLVPVQMVTRFTHRKILEKGSSTTCHALELSEKSEFGKKIKFCAEPNQVGILFDYLQNVAPPTMKWQ